MAANLDQNTEVMIFDGVRDQLTPSKLTETIKLFQPDMVGLSIVSAASKTVLDDIRVVRRLLPDAVIVAGGPHPSLLPHEFNAAAEDSIDYILRGDAETAFRMLVARCWNQRSRDISSRDIADIPGIWSKTRDGMVSSDIPLNQACDELGIPAWDLMPPAEYPRVPQGEFFKNFPVAPVITSRGCPFECGFCSVAALKGKTVRFRSPDLIADEIQLLKNKFGVKEIQFVDDNLTVSKEHVLSVCEAMLNRNLDIPWSCPNGVRVDTLDDDIVEAMKAAGCYSVSVGLETANPDVLERMNKHLDPDKAIEAVHRVARKKIEVNGFFILGYPGDNEANIKDTIRLAKRLPLTRAHFMLFTPFPGSREYERLSRVSGNRVPHDATFAQVSYVPHGMTKKDLKRLHRRAFIEFYARPAAAWKLVKAVNSLNGLYYFLRRTFHWLG